MSDEHPQVDETPDYDGPWVAMVSQCPMCRSRYAQVFPAVCETLECHVCGHEDAPERFEDTEYTG